ncbi:hypothetical protein BraRD5C2_26970 [Bradyrhizobium sp. RD5-C2]|nr:hypothetical protein [Bradyrhizobium sp. RD5-C2]GIQ74258.1 hypothetical protein BraRD5C2_26970 [Bradyrhizobium sp. RD5-C2]
MTMQAHGISDGRSVKDRTRHGGTPLLVAALVAIIGVLGMLMVDHGPWSKPKVQPAASANYSTTGEAARAAGAKVMQTEPKTPIEPAPPGPKPAQPANPSTPQ